MFPVFSRTRIKLLLSTLMATGINVSTTVFAASPGVATCGVAPGDLLVNESFVINGKGFSKEDSVRVQIQDSVSTRELVLAPDANGEVSVVERAATPGNTSITFFKSKGSKSLASCNVTVASGNCKDALWPRGCSFQAANSYVWNIDADGTFLAPGVCDVTITEAGQWDDINNPDHNVFCVQPGDYRSWNIDENDPVDGLRILSLTESGTSANPRWILLQDPGNPGDSTHPVHLPESQQAIMPEFEIWGDHWVIYRMSVKGYSQGSAGRINGAKGTRWSHMLIEDGSKSGFPYITIKQDAATNSVIDSGDYIFQYNVMRNIVPDRENQRDRGFFYINTCNPQPCTIVRNEIINPASFHMQIAPPNYQGGLRIDENEMYMSELARTNCDDGSPDPNGGCASNEQIIVFKAPTLIDATESYVTNNIFHDSPHFDGQSCCSSSSQPVASIYVGNGSAFDNTKRMANVIMEGNIFYNVSQGIAFEGSATYGVTNAVVNENVFYRVDDAVKPNEAVALRTHLGSGTREHHNVIVESQQFLATTTIEKDHWCNIAIDGGTPWTYPVTGIWENNYGFGNTDTALNNTINYTHMGDPAVSNQQELCFASNFITDPKPYCIPRGKVAESSLLYNCVNP